MTAEVWALSTQDGDSGEVALRYDRLVKCRFVTDGPRKTLLADAGIHEFNQIRNIRDANGKQVSPDTIFTVKNLIPVVNAFGYVEEMSYSMTGVAA